jgi:hypothetical protein
MKINLKEKSIYSDCGEFIKKLSCHFEITEEDLVKSEDSNIIGDCAFCKNGVYKTENLSDNEMHQMVAKDSSVCFFVDLNQSNISHIEMGELLYFKNINGSCSIKCFDCGNETDNLIVSLRSQVNEPHQCQECGSISESKDTSCHHKQAYTNTDPIFCEVCKSKNLCIQNQLIG